MSTIKVNTITGIIDMPKDVRIKGGRLGVNFTVDSLGALPDSTSGDSFRPSAGDWFWDSGNTTLKLYLNDSHGWKNIGLTDSAGTGSFSTPAFNRGLIWGGSTWNGSSWGNLNIQYVTIATTGNASTFGDILNPSGSNGNKGSAGGDGTYAVAIFDQSSSIEYVTVATTGNATTFGNTYDSRTGHNDLTGASGAGYHHSVEYAFGDTVRMAYFNIATTGDAQEFLEWTDFTDPNYSSSNPRWQTVVCNDDIGWKIGGRSSNTYINYMHSFTPATPGAGAVSGGGDLRIGINAAHATCDGTRAILHVDHVGILNSSSNNGYYNNNLEYFDMQISSGTTSDFGDLTVARRETAAFASDVRACWAGGADASDYGKTVIDYVTTATPGNATDFGDLSGNRQFGNGTGGAV
jgi:hypothetical protein